MAAQRNPRVPQPLIVGLQSSGFRGEAWEFLPH